MLAVTLVGIWGAWFIAREGAGETYGWNQLGLSLADDDYSRIARVAGEVRQVAGVPVGDHVLSLDGIAIPPGAQIDALDLRIGRHLLHDRAPVRLPLAADSTRWLLLGSRPDDSLYDRQELQLLAELAAPFAQALRISADRTTREATIDARFAAIEDALHAINYCPAPQCGGRIRKGRTRLRATVITCAQAEMNQRRVSGIATSDAKGRHRRIAASVRICSERMR